MASGVPLMALEEDRIAKGLAVVGKPKGMLQILWEHGVVDKSQPKNCTISGEGG